MKLNYDEINKLNLNLFIENIASNQQYKNFFLGNAGQEHYKLLAFFSMLYDNSVILDVGTNRGFSSLSLSYNKSNQVHSFDLYELKELLNPPENIKYYIDNVMKKMYKDLILSASFILLDTFHDGIFEDNFYKYLIEINYVGVLLLDDIFLNNEMKKFWNSITHEKYDITNLGHWSGTGLVIFK